MQCITVRTDLSVYRKDSTEHVMQTLVHEPQDTLQNSQD